MTRRTTVIIPALNEEGAIGDVVASFQQPCVAEVVVVDNGSTDRTTESALAAGARVISEATRGYGRACAAGVLASDPSSEILVFVDGDGSDVAEELPRIVDPVIEDRYDFVIGSRIRGEREVGSMLASQIFAGWLAGQLLRRRYGVRYTDMGPFRAISRTALNSLCMSEMTYGWNLEMQMKAAREKLRILEVPVRYRCRQAGVSKVSGSLLASIRAAVRITQVYLRTSHTEDSR